MLFYLKRKTAYINQSFHNCKGQLIPGVPADGEKCAEKVEKLLLKNSEMFSRGCCLTS